MSTTVPYAWFDGSIVPWAEARIHASSAAVNRGANVFEGVRAYWNDDVRELYLFRNDDHLARLRRSAKIMRMAMPWSDAALTQAQIDAQQANRIEETAWYRLAIYVADEAFLLGTMAEILPIRSVDRYAVGNGAPGPLTRRLQALYFAAVEGRIEKYRKWLTPVYGRVGAAG